MSETATKTAIRDMAKVHANSKNLYALGKKTHGGGVVHFVDSSKCFQFVDSVTGRTTIYAGLERSLKQYFWPNKPPPTVSSYKNRRKVDAKSRFLNACASFASSTGVSSLPSPLIAGKKLGELVHGQIDIMFKTHGAVNSNLVTNEHHALTKAIIKTLEEQSLTVIDTEVVCWDPEHEMATKADAICTKNGRIYVIEFKTGSKKNFSYFNAEITLESGDESSGSSAATSVRITDSSCNRACVQASATCIQYCSTHDIPIGLCTPVVIHAPTPDRVRPIYITREFVLSTAAWIYLETAEARKQSLSK